MRLPTFILVLLMLATASCQPIRQPTPAAPNATSPATPAATPADPLVNTQWRLTSFDTVDSETPVVASSSPTLDFAEAGRVSGNGGCNSFGGDYEAQDDQLVLRSIVSTLMACTDQLIMEQELRYLEILPTITQYQVTDDRLLLSDESGSISLNFVRV